MIPEEMLDCSLIACTHRPQDLIPAFHQLLNQLEPQAADQILSQRSLEALRRDGDACPWWESNHASEVLDELFEALDRQAEGFGGYYFGPHPYDGRHYGFWRHEDDAFEEVPCDINETLYIPVYGESKENP